MKPKNPNNRVSPQDAQLEGVVSMTSTTTQQQTQTMKLPPKDAQLQGVKPIKKNTTQKLNDNAQKKASKGKCATLMFT